MADGRKEVVLFRETGPKSFALVVNPVRPATVIHFARAAARVIHAVPPSVSRDICPAFQKEALSSLTLCCGLGAHNETQAGFHVPAWKANMRLKVLVLEDDAMQADIIARMLEANDCFVEIVRTGREAVRRLCGGTFDVGLIDYRIPDIDGLSVGKAIAALCESHTRPVLIAMTASYDALLERSGAGAEFSAVCCKPIRSEWLMATIETCLQSVRPGLEETVAIADGAASGIQRDRILVADDDANIRLILKQAFEAHGYDVDVVATGVEAIHLIGLHAYKIALIDYQMPELDGLAAAKIIYDHTERRDRPRLIGLTSAPESLVAHDSNWQLVFDDILSKNLGLGIILSTVNTFRDYRTLRTDHPIEFVDVQSMASV
jgi:CheY-like chemotaxis protein